MAYELTGKKKNKEVRYLNKDFSQFRNNLIEFSKQYFPNTYQDFNESSPGMMFIEMDLMLVMLCHIMLIHNLKNLY